MTDSKKPAVQLLYGDGFAGRDYYLIVGDRVAHYELNDVTTLGGPRDVEAARERARAILAEKHPEIVVDLDAVRFTWNGTM